MGLWCYFLIATLLALIVTIPKCISAASCTITKYNANDIKSAVKDCTAFSIGGFRVPPGTTLDLTGLKNGAKVTFINTITWDYKEWTGPLLSISGTNVEIIGASGSVLDGRGKLWWDGKGGNGGKAKPKFFKVALVNSKISNIKILNQPVHGFSISSCKNLVIQGVTIDSSDGDSAGGHNTDGFDIGNSDGVTITNCKVYNQDDCMAVNSGTNIVFSKNYCSGGHGISIGSVGGRSNNVVKNVTVSSCEIVNSDNGVRIKTVYGATGSVSEITYEDIILKNILKNGLVIQGDYQNGSPTGTPTGGLPITKVVMKNIRGTVAAQGTNIYILVQNAKDWNFSGIAISGGTKKKTCSGIPSGAGISC